jgi:hypothetical protein
MPLPAPVLVAPVNSATGQAYAPTLIWTSLSAAISYRVQLATDSTFTTTLIDDSTETDTTRAISSLDASTIYYWRVRGKNSTSTGDWSNRWHFITQALAANEYSVSGSWNMISLPVAVTDGRKSVLFPTSTSGAFSYQGIYRSQDTLSQGVGYWLKFGSDQVVTITGTLSTCDTIFVREGWNMIGSIGIAIYVGDILSNPPGMIASNFFGYNNAYFVADSLKPACGYWVKASINGALILCPSGGSTASNRIRIVPSADTPPDPPDGTRQDTPQMPKEFALMQNYPNPFNPKTDFRFRLPAGQAGIVHSGMVTLRIYDVLGKEVATLVNEVKEPGEYSVSWDAGKFPSGVYFYRLQTGNFSAMKKLILLK